MDKDLQLAEFAVSLGWISREELAGATSEGDIMTPEQEKRVLDAIAGVPGRVWSIRLENPLSPDTTDPKASEWLINTRLQAGYSAGDARKAKDAIGALAAGFGPEVEARVKDALKDAVVDVNVNFPVSDPAPQD